MYTPWLDTTLIARACPFSLKFLSFCDNCLPIPFFLLKMKNKKIYDLCVIEKLRVIISVTCFKWKRKGRIFIYKRILHLLASKLNILKMFVSNKFLLLSNLKGASWRTGLKNPTIQNIRKHEHQRQFFPYLVLFVWLGVKENQSSD